MSPRAVLGFAPYDPVTGRIHLAKAAERAEDVPALQDCVVIAISVAPRPVAVDRPPPGPRSNIIRI